MNKVKNCLHCPDLLQISSLHMACGSGGIAKMILNPFVKREDCPYRESKNTDTTITQEAHDDRTRPDQMDPGQ